MPTATSVIEGGGTVEGHTQKISLLPSSMESFFHRISSCFPGQSNMASLEAAFSASSSASFLVNVVDRAVFLLPLQPGVPGALGCLGLHTGVLIDPHFSVEPGPKRV